MRNPRIVVLLVCTTIASTLTWGCASFVPLQSGNLGSLKGTWEGFRYGQPRGGGYSYTHPSELEIYTDTLPIDGTLIFHQTGAGTVRYRLSECGVVEGRLSCSLGFPGSSVKLGMYENGKIRGDYDVVRFYGTLSFWKKSERTLTEASLPPASASVPLPSDLRIVQPAAGVPKELGAFSGKWAGVWDGILDHILVVEEINPPHAIVVYAHGTSAQWGIDRPGWRREQGEFVGGALKLTLPRRPATAIYRMLPDGTLDATYEYARETSRAKMTRMKE